MTHSFPFSSAVLDSLIPPQTGFDVARDTSHPDLQLYITAGGAKTFFVRKRVRGKDIRKLIGRFPDMSIDEARDATKSALMKMRQPVKVRHGDITLKRMAEIYIKDKVRRAESSKQKLERTIARLWVDILGKKITEITRETLSGLHFEIAMKHGKSTANRMRETLSAIFNYAIEEGYTKENPAKDLENFPEGGFNRRISDGEFHSLIRAMDMEKNPTMRAAMKMLVFGFSNKSDILGMKWKSLDLNRDVWHNKPLSDKAVLLLEQLPQKSKYVFPNTAGAKGHITDPKRAWKRITDRAGLSNMRIADIYKTLRGQVDKHEGNIRRQINSILDRIA
ncbi:MAG: integrase arm-type DNA-binding domain-containing protein [Rickettsiales bacterium]|jgi:hypothetical protein|nr:integrase arm-type DNA-binding domain-containing protein [Rickettsiales bacterium]